MNIKKQLILILVGMLLLAITVPSHASGSVYGNVGYNDYPWNILIAYNDYGHDYDRGHRHGYGRGHGHYYNRHHYKHKKRHHDYGHHNGQRYRSYHANRDRHYDRGHGYDRSRNSNRDRIDGDRGRR